MGGREVRFGGIVVASLAGVVGVKYLLGASLALLRRKGDVSTVLATSSDPLLTGGSVLGTAAAATLLLLAAGMILTGVGYARYWTLGTFVVVVALGLPSLLSSEPVSVLETVGIGAAVLYLLRRDPLHDEARTAVDDEGSATRIGSTLR